MRILHIGEYVVGGMATYINEVVGYQQQFFDVYLLMSEHNSATDFELDSSHILYYKYKRHPKYFLSAMRQIHKIIEKVQPDIIHIHSSFAGLLARGLFLYDPRRQLFFIVPMAGLFLWIQSQYTKRDIS